MKVLVTGATGMLGTSLVHHLRTSKYEVCTHGLTGESDFNCDLTNFEEVKKLIDLVKPQFIYNLVALTNVDECENKIDLAFRINVLTIENISSVLASNNLPVHLIHLSTDMVYDSNLLSEESDVKISNIYSLTKYASELAALRFEKSVVLRVNFFGKSRVKDRLSFTDWLFKSVNDRQKIYVFDDIFFTPLSIDTLCQMMLLVMRNSLTGVFNLGSCDGMSKALFARKFAQKFGLTEEYFIDSRYSLAKHLKANRPMDMRMNCKKIENAIGVKMPSLEQEISNLRGYK